MSDSDELDVPLSQRGVSARYRCYAWPRIFCCTFLFPIYVCVLHRDPERKFTALAVQVGKRTELWKLHPQPPRTRRCRYGTQSKDAYIIIIFDYIHRHLARGLSVLCGTRKYGINLKKFKSLSANDESLTTDLMLENSYFGRIRNSL